ncbi:MAG: glycosyltransferase [Actinobacteria bacterium]|nr:glycosyltransferase [Actinomycetota bacterium]
MTARSTHVALPSVGVVILTQGSRPVELDRAVRSVLAQTGVATDVVVVGNGWRPTGLPPEVSTVELPTNVGVGGRNAGVGAVRGDVLFFLDDDAWLADDTALESLAGLFRDHPAIGMVQTRLADPESATAPRYWIPRLRKGSATRSSTVMYVLEAALAIRREVFEQIGGFVPDFGYAHEGIDLTWRVWDAGYLVWYAGDLVTCHPAIYPTRHAEFWRLNARNRVWLARRNLPAVLIPGYLATWAAVEHLRLRRDPAARRAWLTGFKEGWSTTAVSPRHPMSWRTVAEMTRHGRPPIV